MFSKYTPTIHVNMPGLQNSNKLRRNGLADLYQNIISKFLTIITFKHILNFRNRLKIISKNVDELFCTLLLFRKKQIDRWLQMKLIELH